MSIWVSETAYALGIFLVSSSIFLLPFIYWQFKKFGSFNVFTAFSTSMMVLYFCSILAFTLFPFPNFQEGYCKARDDIDHWQLNPLESLTAIVNFFSKNGFYETLTSDIFLQVFMNIIFFMPLGFFLHHFYYRTLKVSLIFGICTSLAIELTQGTAIWGLVPCAYRVADIDDVITNSFGAVTGWFLARLLQGFIPKISTIKTPDLAEPGKLRIVLGNFLTIYLYGLFEILSVIVLGILNSNFYTNHLGQVVISLFISSILYIVLPLLSKDRSLLGMSSVRVVTVKTQNWSEPRSLTEIFNVWAIYWVPVAFLGTWWLLIIFTIDCLGLFMKNINNLIMCHIHKSSIVTKEQYQEIYN